VKSIPVDLQYLKSRRPPTNSDFAMALKSPNNGFVGLIGRYLAKLSAWTKLRIGRYGVAFGLLAIGALMLVVAAAIGTAAGFHFLELRYGIWTAYGIVGGAFAGSAAIALIAGWVILKAKPPSMPAPPTPARLLRHAVAPIALRLSSTAEARRTLPVDPRTGLFAAGAALLLVAWVTGRSRPDHRPPD
jgi:hypothetical protein